jgi:hypothetical protein
VNESSSQREHHPSCQAPESRCTCSMFAWDPSPIGFGQAPPSTAPTAPILASTAPPAPTTAAATAASTPSTTSTPSPNIGMLIFALAAAGLGIAGLSYLINARKGS